MFRLLLPYAPLLVVSLLFCGCYSPARRLEVSSVKRLSPGMSRAEAEQVIGAPKETILGSNGKTVARYFFDEYHRLNDSSQYAQFHRPAEVLFRSLSLLYNDKGVLERKLHDESVTPVRRNWNEWIEFGPALDKNNLAISKEAEQPANLVKRFGEPMSRTLDSHGHVILNWLYFRARADRLGQPTARILSVLTNGDAIEDFALAEVDPRFWFSDRWPR
jgi:hypothetical protein